MTTFWERAAHSMDHMLYLYFDYLLFKLFPVFVLRVGAPFPVYCILVILKQTLF